MTKLLLRIRVAVTLFALACSSAALAQLPTQPLTVADAAAHISEAQSELLVVLTMVQNHTIAQALHDAAYKRGIAVYILVPLSEIESPSSEINSLIPAGAKVRVTEVDDNLIVVDRREILKGEALAVTGEDTVVTIDDAGEVDRVTNIFIEHFETADVYEPILLERPKP
jgi:Archaeal transcriptional regulator TrmB